MTVMAPCQQKRFRIGYAFMATKSFFFAQDVSESLRQAAYGMQIELVEVDNPMNARVAVGNSDL